jgi:hypothetical protein
MSIRTKMTKLVDGVRDDMPHYAFRATEFSKDPEPDYDYAHEHEK